MRASVECIHNFGESESRAWAQLKSRKFVAAVAWRAPNTTKGGAAIIVDMQKLGEGAEVRVVELPVTASPRLRAGVAMADVHWGGRVVKFGSMYAPSDAK